MKNAKNSKVFAFQSSLRTSYMDGHRVVFFFSIWTLFFFNSIHLILNNNSLTIELT